MAAYSSPTACGSALVKPTAEKSPLARASASEPAAASSAVPESLPLPASGPELSGSSAVQAARTTDGQGQRRQADESGATHGACLPNGPV